ncbi:MAG: galactokinase [Lentisphaeraceae bacterium]|nr:galactokinase [Lentisphaeraceae bacterium]
MQKDVLAEKFLDVFGSSPEVYSRAPGRVEILGNHTDYNEGYVLSMAVDRYTSLAMKHSSGNFRIYSDLVEEPLVEFPHSEIAIKTNSWVDYLKGVVIALKSKGLEVTPVDIFVTSDVPLSAGMSSSASFEMALVEAFCLLFSFELSMAEKAKVGQSCENDFIGANTGLMDQFTSLSGEEGSFVFSEYRNFEVKRIPFPAGCGFVVFNTAVKHDLSLDYNVRRQACENAVAEISKSSRGIKALRDIDQQLLASYKSLLGKDVFARALHVVGENERVSKALSFLSVGDIESFGQLLFDSHQSSIENFENSCPELDFLVKASIESRFCLGARLSGGGFGGISIHLVQDQQLKEFREEMSLIFEQEFGFRPKSYVCKSANGASSHKYLS